MVIVQVRASVLSQVPWCGDCPLELTKVVSESERMALRDGIVSLCERSQQWFEQRRLESLHHPTPVASSYTGPCGVALL